MKEGLSGSAIRSLIPSHRDLLRSKAVVVSVAEVAEKWRNQSGRDARFNIQRCEYCTAPFRSYVRLLWVITGNA